MTQSKLQIIEEFLLWLDNETYYEVGEYVESGEHCFYSVSYETLLKEYEEAGK